ncbi:uncharacterized protein LOC123267237 [Cotesia glomerata]|uniref:uncharacterized protein LOC123267237 n=1 Tax=Cotesia glomerata TaxID=32391 RepID=UPI001D0280A4|nr:uncharacterized protein LOC123267237 [Cotesia glomerata]XP_044587726.1 uncharacterized protein LOC123267237 [Cotesia glomerata]
MMSNVLIFGLFLTIYVTNTSAYNKSCAKLGEVCKDEAHCCNKFNGCYLSLKENFSHCGGDGLLDSSCRHPIECSKILGGTCKNGICDCKSDHRRYNRHRCKPRHLKPWARWHD